MNTYQYVIKQFTLYLKYLLLSSSVTDVFLNRTSGTNLEHEDVYAEIRESMMVDLDPNSPRIKSTYGNPVDQMFHQSNNVYNKPID